MASVQKKVRIRADVDRISILPDELIHRILSFIDTKCVVRTSKLSKRWKHIWKTVPHLKLNSSNFYVRGKFSKFIRDLFSHRDQQSDVLEMKLIGGTAVRKVDLVEFVKYAVAHNAQTLIVTRLVNLRHFPLSIFSSTSLKKLKLAVDLCLGIVVFTPDTFWSLPALTYLDLQYCNLPESCFSLPALATLCMYNCKLPKSTWDLPALKSLVLKAVEFRENRSEFFSELVNLRNLTLHLCIMYIEVCNIWCPQLVNLKISCKIGSTCKFVVSAPKLYSFKGEGIMPIIVSSDCLKVVNIKIKDDISYAAMNLWTKKFEQSLLQLPIMFQELHSAKILTLDSGTIKVLSAVLDLLIHQPSPFCNLKYVKLPKGYAHSTIPSTVRTYLLSGSPSATVITEFPQINVNPQIAPVPMTAQNVDIEEPLAIPSNLLPVVREVIARVNVKESELVAAEHDLAGPSGMTSPPMQTDGRDKGSMPHQYKLLARNVDEGGVREPTAILVPYTRKSPSRAYVVELGGANEVKVQEEHVEKKSGVDVDSFRLINIEQVTKGIQGQVNEVIGAAVQAVLGLPTDAPGAGVSNDQASSSNANSDFGLWQGHEVKLENVGLLDLIREKYPETFEHFNPQSKKFYTIRLNMLCTSVNAFSLTSTAEVNTDMVIEYRDLFADLQRWGFNITWLVSRLNYIEQLRFSQPLVDELHAIDHHIEDAKTELQNLQDRRTAKMKEIQEAFGHMGTRLAMSYIGDGLFSGH